MNTASNSLPLPETGSPFASALLFALPALALAAGFGVGAAQAALVLVFPLVVLLRPRAILTVYRRHGLELAGVIAAFCAWFAVSLLRAGSGPASGQPPLDWPLALLGLASIGVMYHLRPRARQLWAGLCAAGVLAALLAIYHLPGGAARAVAPGYASTLGDLALACGLMGLCGLGALRHTRLAWLPVPAVLCGMAASLMAGAHGWLALALALIPLLVYARSLADRRLLALCGLALVIACVMPAVGMAGRIGAAIEEVQRYLAAGTPLDSAVLLLLYLAPLCHFILQLRRPDRGQHPLALAGLVLVAAFVGFTLDGAMPLAPAPESFYVLLVGSLAGLCLAARHHPPPRRIMITRTDNIGDVVLTLSLAGYLKQIYPQAEIVFLCRRYAAAVVAQCRHVDRVLTLEELGGDQAGAMARADCDTVLFAFPRRHLAIAAFRAGIARRVGSSRRVYHWFTANRLINISAKKTPLHEAQLSFKLLLPLGIDFVPTLEQVWKLYGLTTPRHPAADAVLAAPGFKLILHPKSNGNGREWPLEHYTTLARMLGAAGGVRVLVTGSPAEGELLAEQAPALLALPNVENMCGRLDLEGFTALIGGCDGLIASGTGPLHLAAALGRPVVGLFPPLKPIDPSRWAAVGPRAHNLVTAQPCGHCADPARCTCMLAIAPQQVFDLVQGWRADAAQAAA
ncbi:ADP-heptose:LPS heptosyltransferase [Duganella sp. CF517]|uniref:glycosyltransferase family 9 protein n=1 Tax=Duganella sp. CF517 TaxID=1881038 RepID=UPI0008B4B82B|nr:glycosyltransferase family 9 protein [Duganella sp. CF517]SEO20803.1 ADP-heptose:LPS heptosyltransferase [Duganella sp. CF517]